MFKFFMIYVFVALLLLSGCSSVPMNTQDKTFNKYKKYDYCKMEATIQSQKNSCGSACLTSVLNYWGIDITEEDILSEYSIKETDGYSILELRQIVEDKGLIAYGYSMNESFEEQLEEQILKGRPVICAVDFPYDLYFANDIPIYRNHYNFWVWCFGLRRSHYIVVFGLKDNKFLVMDPIYGIVSLSKKDFYSAWKTKDYGVLLCAKKEYLNEKVTKESK